MKREIRKFIESELRDYENTKREWEMLQDELTYNKNSAEHDDYMERIGLQEPERCNGQTESKALKILTNKRLAQLERTIRAFEKVITNLPEEKFRLVVLKFWTVPQMLTDDGIAQELNCDKRTLYRWMDGIFLALGKEMGFID